MLHRKVEATFGAIKTSLRPHDHRHLRQLSKNATTAV